MRLTSIPRPSETPSLRSALYGVGVVAVVCLVVLVCVVAVPQAVGGSASFIVMSDSMNPEIQAGDVVITESVSPDEIESGAIETGDVITYGHGSDGETSYVTHRVVDIYEEGGETYVETRGNANDESDGLVPANLVEGTTILQIPYLGSLLLFARSGVGLALFVILPAMVLVGIGLRQLVGELGHLVRFDRESQAPTESDEDSMSIENQDTANTDVRDGPGDGEDSGSSTVTAPLEADSQGGSQ